MNDKTKPTALFWIVGVALLLFGLMGVSMYLVEMTMDEAAYLETYGPIAAEIRPVTPKWAIAGYAIGVWTGLLATLLLLLRKALCVPVYIISFLGALLGWIWYVINPRGRQMLEEQSGWIMMLFVLITCLFSIWWAIRQKSIGVIG